MTTTVSAKPSRISSDERLRRVSVANRVLGMFAEETSLSVDRGYVVVHWKTTRQEYARRWMTRGQDFYPVWYRYWPHGGTASTALSQLVRWVQGKPVVSLASWRYWHGEQIKLLKADGASLLASEGYPAVATCVLCGIELTRGSDWWSLDGVTGPCCSGTQGCRQRVGSR